MRRELLPHAGFRDCRSISRLQPLRQRRSSRLHRLPLPPLSSWGLTRFADFERSNPDGITYLDTFFLKQHQSKNEAIHFHELIHVIQWRILGSEKFLRAYADGLENFGYRNSPLEVMAYDAEKRFVSSTAQFNAEQFVTET